MDVRQRVLQPCLSLEKKRRRGRPAKKRMKSVNLLRAIERRRRRMMMRRSILRAQSSIWLDLPPQSSSFTVPSCMQGLKTFSIFNSYASHQFVCPCRSLLESDFVGHIFKRNVIAAIHPDGLWSFPSHLNKEEEEEEEERHSTTEALKVIETLAPVVMVQHMQCEKRPLYTALLEVLFYYTYKFSYCSPFSSRFLTSPALAQTLKCQLI